jgi:hypothetical protein
MNTDHNWEKERKNELQEAPLLSSMQAKKDVFEVPVSYFEKLPSSIQDKISSKSNSHNWKLNPLWLSVLVGCLVLGIGFLYFDSQQTKKSSTEMAVSCDDVIESDYYLEIDESVIIEQLASIPGNPKSTDNTEIDNYILNSIDESTLINAL